MATEAKALTDELKGRCLDFAKRLCLKGHPELTEARRQKLWVNSEEFLRQCLGAGCTGWEDGPDYYPCDVFSEHFETYDVPDWKFERDIENKFFAQLRSICRTAFDIIDGMPGGVFGYRLGDIRLIFDGQLPDWFCEGWTNKDGSPVTPAQFNELGDEERFAI